MRAVRIARHGGPEVLEVVDVPPPAVGQGEVEVEVTHVGMNHLDVWVRRGVDGHRFPLPLIPGSDIVGRRTDSGALVVVQPGVCCGHCRWCGEGRPNLCRSYRLRGEMMDGGCCERVVVAEHELLPCVLAPAEAASLPLALLTAWHMLTTRARLQPGDRVFVQAGAGGVASLAIQVARALGARVVATASTPEKRALCVRLGAEEAWSYQEALAGIKAWTGRQGVDIVVEHTGAATWDLSLRAVRWGGTVVLCGATAGHDVKLDLRALFYKQLNLMGSTMGSPAELRRAWELVTDGRIRPVVDRVLPMTRIGEAHALLEGRSVLGKVVLEQDLV